MNAPLAQRQEEIRSREYLDGAKGETCKLRFEVCNHNPETTVPCHVHDQNFGMGQKAHDIAVIDGCAACHAFLDHGWVGKITREVRLEHIVRGLLETFLNRVRRGIVKIKLDRVTPHHEKPVPPRLPAAQRMKVPKSRPLQSASRFATGRKIPSRVKEPS